MARLTIKRDATKPYVVQVRAYFHNSPDETWVSYASFATKAEAVAYIQTDLDHQASESFTTPDDADEYRIVCPISFTVSITDKR